jgi:hypothetical protein
VGVFEKWLNFYLEEVLPGFSLQEREPTLESLLGSIEAKEIYTESVITYSHKIKFSMKQSFPTLPTKCSPLYYFWLKYKLIVLLFS